MKFRNDISFLRAFSVLSVLFYHFGFNFFKGGFIGVDIFFVISGYLMTRIILSSFEKNNFNLFDFYKKRVVRIFPALLVMISLFAITIYFLLPTQFLNYLKSCFASSLFFSNFYYYLNTGYFNPQSQFNFLLHTWSLSVEWQFYMIYPLLLLVLRKVYISKANVFKTMFWGLIILSVGFMLFHSENPSLSFYMPYTRAWEMMFGGLAFIYENKAKNINRKSKSFILGGSLVAILLVIFFVNSYSVQWPSFLTFIPVVATTLILFINNDLKIYSNKIIIFLGNISYSLYLYHWPIYVFSLFISLNDRFRYKLLFIILSFILSTLSYYLIEKRSYQKKSLLIFSVSLLIFSISYSFSKLDPNILFNKRLAALSSANSKYIESDMAIKQYGFNGSYFKHSQLLSNFDLNKIKTDPNKKYILLLGDSHAGMFAQTIHNIVKTTDYEFIQITADGTFPMYNSETDFEGPKEYFNYFFEKYFPQIKDQVELIILNSNYSAYELKKLEKKIEYTENYFSKNKTRVLYIGQTQSYSVDFPTYSYVKEAYNTIPRTQTFNVRKNTEVNSYMKNRLGENYIDLMAYDIKPISENGLPYIYDTNHLTYFGTEQYFDILKTKINNKLIK